MDNRNNDYYYDKTDSGENNYSTGAQIDITEIMASRGKSRAWSVAGFMCALASLVCCCFSVVGIVLGAFGILFAVISRINLGYFDKFSLAALIIGIFGVIFGIAGIIMTETMDMDAIFEEFLKEYQEQIPDDAGTTDINGGI